MNMKRMRGRNNRGPGGGGGGGGGGPIRHQTGNVPLNRNHIFDSSGPDLRIRGTSQQLFEKYLQLGRDATSSGDRVMSESYFQHAEHYFRILNAMNQAAQAQGQQPGQQGGQHQGGQQHAGQQQGGQQQGGQYRRQPYESHGNEPQTPEQMSGELEEDDDHRHPEPEPRDIPIATTPPDA